MTVLHWNHRPPKPLRRAPHYYSMFKQNKNCDKRCKQNLVLSICHKWKGTIHLYLFSKGFTWSHWSIKMLISPRQCAITGSFLAIFGNFTNLVLVTSSLLISIVSWVHKQLTLYSCSRHHVMLYWRYLSENHRQSSNKTSHLFLTLDRLSDASLCLSVLLLFHDEFEAKMENVKAIRWERIMPG